MAKQAIYIYLTNNRSGGLANNCGQKVEPRHVLVRMGYNQKIMWSHQPGVVALGPERGKEHLFYPKAGVLNKMLLTNTARHLCHGSEQRTRRSPAGKLKTALSGRS